MKKALVVVGMCALMVMVGCKSSSERGGGAPTDQGFRVVVPAGVTLRQGEADTATVRLDRGDYFKRDVRLAMQVSGQGVMVEPADVVVRASDPADVKVRVSAAPNAALGEYRVQVTGTPEAGVPTTVQFKVTVKEP